MTLARKLWTAAFGLLLIALVVFGWQPLRRSSLDRLRNAVAAEPFRYIEPRLSLLPEYRPLDRRRGVAPAGQLSRLRMAAAAVAAEVTDSDARVQASALLIAGDAPAAVQVLRAVVNPDATTFGDLSAALLAESEVSGQVERATDALAAADKALRVNPRFAAASFNRALALQRLGLLTEARAEWDHYSQLDPASGWSVEARAASDSGPETDAETWKRAEKQARRASASHDVQTLHTIVARYPQLTRVYGEGVYLAEWADGNDHALELARALGDQLRKLNGEQLLGDAVAAIDYALLRDQKRAEALADAHRDYRDGRLAFRDRRLEAAENKLLAAEEAFTRGGSPMALLARYYRGGVLYEQSRIKEAEQLLDALADTASAYPGYRALAAQIGWERGLCRMANGSFDRAREIFIESREILEKLGERELRASFDVHLAQVMEYVGDADEAWYYRRRAFETLSQTGNEFRILVALAGTASARIRREEWERAAALSKAAASMSERLKRADLAAQAWIMSSTAATAERRREDALNDLRNAERWIREIADAKGRGRLDAERAIAAAVALRDSNPEASVAQLNQSTAYLEHSGFRNLLPRAYLERARAHRAAGDIAAAIGDIERGIGIAEKQRIAVTDFEERGTFFAATKALFLEGIDLQLSAGDVERAFDIAERGRARAIADSFSDREMVQPIRARQLQRILAPDAALISYVFFGRRVSIFFVRDREVIETEAPFTNAAVRTAIKLWHDAVAQRDSRAIVDAQRQLYAIFFSPVEQYIDGVRTVAVVTDPTIGAIPFSILATTEPAALRRREFAVVAAPSATVAVMCSQRAPKGNEVPLIVGATVFDAVSASAGQLQSIVAEVNSVESEWPHARVLLGDHATQSAFETLAPAARFIHFAGHGVDRARSPAEAHLLLAPRSADRGELTAAEVARLDLRSSEFVVLNACRTASGSEKSDGFVNLATAFILAGVPSVVSSSTDVDDSTANEFSRRLHHHLARGEEPEIALQKVLRQEIDSSGIATASTRYGGFTVIGGSKSLVLNEEQAKKGN